MVCYCWLVVVCGFDWLWITLMFVFAVVYLIADSDFAYYCFVVYLDALVCL